MLLTHRTYTGLMGISWGHADRPRPHEYVQNKEEQRPNKKQLGKCTTSRSKDHIS